MKSLRFLALSAGFAASLHADVLYTLAGTPVTFGSTLTKISSSGATSTFANFGVGTTEGSGKGLAFDRAGNLYVAVQFANRIDRFTPAGVRSVFASTLMNAPQGIAFDAAGNLFVANGGGQNDNTIVKFTPAGAGSVFVTNVRNASGLAFDKAGNLFAATAGTIVKFTPAGERSTFANSSAILADQLAFDAAGNLYATSPFNSTIARFAADGSSSIFATPSGRPLGLAFDSGGSLHAALEGGTIVRFTPAGVPTTFATGLGTNSYLVFTTDAGVPLPLPPGGFLAPPVILAPPQSHVVPPGTGVIFSVTTASTALSYQWRFNGSPIAGATDATYSVTSANVASAGAYTVVVSNAGGAVTSEPATLTITPGLLGRLTNLSILTSLSGAGDSFTLGYVVGGAGTSGAKPVIIRAAGPSLTPLGVGGALADPKLEFFAGQAKSGENDNWGGGTALLSAMDAVGAFRFAGPASLDAAVATSVAAGDNSVKVSPVGNLSGTVIAEIYDATPPAAFTLQTPRLINVSVLKNIGASLTAGFVLGGGASRTVLIRAVGPALGAAPFNVPGVLADPQLALFNAAGVKIGENDNWGGGAALTQAMAQVTFALPAASRDAALLATLAPGAYTVQVTGVGGTSGVALIEIYAP